MIISPGPPTAADVGATIALRHLEDAARNADPTATILQIIRTARDTLFQEIEANEKAATK